MRVIDLAHGVTLQAANDDDLAKAVREHYAAHRVGMPVAFVRDEGSGNSDHREFNLLGMPAAKLGVGAGGEPCRHMACDRPGRLDPHSLRLARRIAERALLQR